MVKPALIYGFSTPQSEIEAVLGLKPGDLERYSLDMDLADTCRWLRDQGIDMQDEAAVRTALHRFPPCEPPEWVDAVVMVAKSYSQRVP